MTTVSVLMMALAMACAGDDGSEVGGGGDDASGNDVSLDQITDVVYGAFVVDLEASGGAGAAEPFELSDPEFLDQIGISENGLTGIALASGDEGPLVILYGKFVQDDLDDAAGDIDFDDRTVNDSIMWSGRWLEKNHAFGLSVDGWVVTGAEDDVRRVLRTPNSENLRHKNRVQRSRTGRSGRRFPPMPIFRMRGRGDQHQRGRRRLQNEGRLPVP
ncbi:MAG: hypothetical protein QF554_08680 [Dehalococcoidia bacterium]|nr:hypothetical protein [Dehalococcoidia bacterium]